MSDDCQFVAGAVDVSENLRHRLHDGVLHVLLVAAEIQHYVRKRLVHEGVLQRSVSSQPIFLVGEVILQFFLLPPFCSRGPIQGVDAQMPAIIAVGKIPDD